MRNIISYDDLCIRKYSHELVRYDILICNNKLTLKSYYPCHLLILFKNIEI